MNYTERQHTDRVMEYNLEGEISACKSAMDLVQDISSRLGKGFKVIVLNCTRTTYVNSSGIQFLLKVQRTIAAAKGQMAISNVPEALEPILEQIGLLDHIPRIKSMDEVLKETASNPA